jgi:hypothetical protein
MTVTSLLDPQPPKQENLLLCKDCIHYQYFHHQDEEICGRRAKLLNPVSGKVIDNWSHRQEAKCKSERSTWAWFAFLLGHCGTQARFFQKKS